MTDWPGLKSTATWLRDAKGEFMSQERYDLTEFVREGFLQEVNRTFFHPIGMALAVYLPEIEEEGEPQLRLVTTEDPTGFTFAELETDKVRRVTQVRKEYAERRLAGLGFIVQPAIKSSEPPKQ